MPLLELPLLLLFFVQVQFKEIKKINSFFSIGIVVTPIDDDYRISLATSGVIADTYGSATAVPQLTIDTYGRITNALAVSLPILESNAYTPTFTWILGGSVAPTTVRGIYFRMGDYVHGSIFVESVTTTEFAGLFALSAPILPNNNWTNDYDVIGVSSLDHADTSNNTLAVIEARTGHKTFLGIIKSETPSAFSLYTTTFAYKINN